MIVIRKVVYNTIWNGNNMKKRYMDFSKQRLSSIERFPKVTREKMNTSGL